MTAFGSFPADVEYARLRPNFDLAFLAGVALGKAFVDAEAFGKSAPATLHLESIEVEQVIALSPEFRARHGGTTSFLETLCKSMLT